jgi:hypothetical protein
MANDLLYKASLHLGASHQNKRSSLFYKIPTVGNRQQIHFSVPKDATERLGYCAEQKEVVALRVLGYAEALDQPDHFLRMSEESIRQSFFSGRRNIFQRHMRGL